MKKFIIAVVITLCSTLSNAQLAEKYMLECYTAGGAVFLKIKISGFDFRGTNLAIVNPDGKRSYYTNMACRISEL